MRRLALVLILLALTRAVAAEDAPRTRVDLDVLIPVPPVGHQRLHYFGSRRHHLVPGTVTINGSPYVCDLDHLHFVERDAFVAHLRTVHHTPPERIPDRLLVLDGRVHFVGE